MEIKALALEHSGHDQGLGLRGIMVTVLAVTVMVARLARTYLEK